MYIISMAYDDGNARIMDTWTFQTREMTESELIEFARNNEVIGLEIKNNKIKRIRYVRFHSFVEEAECDIHIKRWGGNSSIKRSERGLWYAMSFYDDKKPIKYIVVAYNNNGTIYRNGKSTTPFIDKATLYDKQTALNRATTMNRKYYTNCWTIQQMTNPEEYV